MRLTPEQQRLADGDMRDREQAEHDRRAASLARILPKGKPRKRKENHP